MISILKSYHVQLTCWLSLVIICLIIQSCSSSVRFADKVSSPKTHISAAPPKPAKAINLTGKIKSKKTVSLNYSPPETNDADQFRQRLIDRAREWIGVPYAWGGNSRKGVDCSGFVMEIFKKESFMLPRTAAGQFHYLGIEDNMDNLTLGDLVFFSYDGTHINHVGIYSGYGMMIHASSSRGVIEDTFISGYFRGKFAGGGKIIS